MAETIQPQIIPPTIHINRASVGFIAVPPCQERTLCLFYHEFGKVGLPSFGCVDFRDLPQPGIVYQEKEEQNSNDYSDDDADYDITSQGSSNEAGDCSTYDTRHV
jgi:hypothetical protein